MRRIRLWVPVLAALMAAVTGCSDPYAGRMAISGKVTLKNQPLNDAYISFEPMDGGSTASGAEIKNGEYKIERQQGLKPGKYVVRITAGDGKTPANQPEDEVAGPGGSTNIVSMDRIPREWNVATDKQIEVKDSGENTFNFDIPNENVPRKGSGKDPKKR